MTDTEIYTWIFLSVSDSRQPASLVDIIAGADFINHAIPMPKELQAGFGWLQAQKLIRKEEGKYLLTETGFALRGSISHRSIHTIWDAIVNKLLLFPEIEYQPDNITEAEVTAAYKSYKNMCKIALRKFDKKKKPKKNSKTS